MEKRHLIGYPIVAIIVALITYYCSRGEDPIPPTPIQPKEIISLEDAVELYRGYTDNRACVIELFEKGNDSTAIKTCNPDRKTNPKFVPARSFHLNDEFLNQYIAYIKGITPDSIKISGYRLYLGNYPQAKEFKDGKSIRETDEGRNTFFIAPTTQLGNSDMHRGYTFLDRNNDGKPELIFIEDTIQKLEKGKLGSLYKRMHPEINTASFFSFLSSNYDDLSTIANDLGGHP